VQLRLAVAAELEAPSVSAGVVRRGLADVWGRLASPTRDLHLPRGCRVVGVGGATLGGSGRTPVVQAVAEALWAAGARVVVVGHGYRALRAPARVVSVKDTSDDVGDEARLLADSLPSVPIVVGGSRQRAVDLAATLGDIVVVDGLLQAAPERLALAILAVDAERPWGAGACPPLGDLRAPPGALLAAADCVLRVGVPSSGAAPFAPGVACWEAPTWHRLSRALAPDHRAALFVSVARPERVLRALSGLGVVPSVVVRAPDHRAGDARRAIEAARAEPTGRAGPLQWILTEKCLAGLGGNLAAHAIFGENHTVLRQRLELPVEMRARLHRLHYSVP
jgi:tetraacyldisaccharide 4'-kinase